MIGKLQTKTNFNEPFVQLKIELGNKPKKKNKCQEAKFPNKISTTTP
jgi:hypothetical protein